MEWSHQRYIINTLCTGARIVYFMVYFYSDATKCTTINPETSEARRNGNLDGRQSPYGQPSGHGSHCQREYPPRRRQTSQLATRAWPASVHGAKSRPRNSGTIADAQRAHSTDLRCLKAGVERYAWYSLYIYYLKRLFHCNGLIFFISLVL